MTRRSRLRAVVSPNEGLANIIDLEQWPKVDEFS